MISQRKTQMLGSFAIEVEGGSGNVYADLGFNNSEQMPAKARLVAKIDEIVRRRRLMQARAAELLGMPQSKLSAMLRGRFQGISATRMIECLTRLGRDVEIAVKPAFRSNGPGRVSSYLPDSLRPGRHRQARGSVRVSHSSAPGLPVTA